MRTLHLIDRMDPKLGGVGQAVLFMAEGLSVHSVYNEIACLDAPTAPFVKHPALNINALGPAKRPWGYSPKLLPWLLHNLLRFDLVIIHGLWLYHGYAVRQAIRILRKRYWGDYLKHRVPKLFVMPHGMLDPYFQRAPGRKLKALRNWVYWKVIEAKLINQADAVLFTCEEERRLAAKPFSPYHPKSEKVVGLGVEEPPTYNPKMKEAFSRKCPELEGNTYLLFLGRIHEKKGVDLLIRAYANVARKMPELATQKLQTNRFPRLLIAGPGLDSSYGKKIQQLVFESSELRNSVFFANMLSGDLKWGAFYGCEAFILPSHQENFGIAVVEALSCCKPVLISNQINVWREIQAERGGIIGADTQNDTEKILNCWIRLSVEEKQAMSQCARSTYEKYFAAVPSVSRLFKAVSV